MRYSYPRPRTESILDRFRLTSVDLSVEQLETTPFGAEKQTFVPGYYTVRARRGPDIEVAVRSLRKPDEILTVIAGGDG